MIRRLLIILVAIVALSLWLRRLIASARGSRAPEAGRSADRRAVSGRMVRDRVCNTFLPKNEAIRLEIGQEEHFFCSETCRDRFLAEAKKTRKGV